MYCIIVNGETVEYADTEDFAHRIAESWQEMCPDADVQMYSEVEK